MAGRAALPALVAGALGLAFGLLAVIVDSPLLGLVAGLSALASGAASLGMGRRMEEQAAMQRLVEEELRSVRAEAKETEARVRGELQSTMSRSPADDDDYLDDGTDPLTDDITGLFSEDFFTVALDSRVAAARRHLRPVAVVLLEVVEGLPIDAPEVADATVVAEAIRRTLREADTACRLRNGEFALLLEDTPENGAIWTVERIRRFLSEASPKVTLWAGVACYPAHAFTPQELMTAAGAALASAREWRQDRIEVALVASD